MSENSADKLLTKERYLADGTKVNLHYSIDEFSHLISFCEKRDEEEWTSGLPVVYYGDVYDDPDSIKHSIDEEIERKLKVKDDLEDELKSIRNDIKEEKEQLDKIRKSFVAKDQLNQIFDLIEGRITHAIRYNDYGYMEITTLDEAISWLDDYSHSGRQLKLLSLFGDSKGNFGYRINAYSDGSGTWSKVLLAKSEEEAKEVARTVISGILNERPSINIIELADQYGVPVSDAVRRAEEAKRIDQLKKSIKSMKKDIEKKQDRLNEMRAEIRRIG